MQSIALALSTELKTTKLFVPLILQTVINTVVVIKDLHFCLLAVESAKLD